ncbi:hypothetical protein [Thiolapillus sp.]|uniref:hypothetical protein n=1 Tax=Thiolapillus sp. TaxID=2017437 RepID=UPI0025E8B16D|nr:hypothetical protein [Thiolapillus sp.]
MTRTAGARIGCQRPSRFWGLGCPKIYHEVEDTLVLPLSGLSEPFFHLHRSFLLGRRRLMDNRCIAEHQRTQRSVFHQRQQIG